jgi:glutamate-1-semialdehyde 2,1-aminomutase
LQDVLIAPYNDIEATRKIIEQNASELAAVIIEPILGNLGMIPSTRDYLLFLREITRANGIMLIFDEIITYRLSLGGVQKIHDICPDLTTFGKIIGGGLPIGAFGGREDIMDIFSPKRAHPMHHSGTFNGNAVTMAAGIAAMKLVDQALIDRINTMGNRLRTSLQELFIRKGIRGQVTGMGSLMNVHFSTRQVTDLRSAKENWRFSLPVRDLLNLALKNRGIYTPRRLMLSISAPMTDDEIQQTITAFDHSIDSLKPIIKRHCPELLL